MKLLRSRRAAGFTLIEIIVVIAIMVTLVAVSAPMLAGKLKTGDVEKCRANLSQLSTLGVKYGQDFAHSRLLPTSGMADDEDTPYIDESEGWWLSLAQEMDAVVLPQKDGDKMKISEIFHCPSDVRGGEGNKGIDAKGMMAASTTNVSYVSWTDGSEDPENPNSCIRTSAKQRLDELPWLSDGVPVKGESVTDVDSFRKMVRPAFERHADTILVAYAGGSVKAYEVDTEESMDKLFKRIAPELANKADKADKGKGKKKGKRARRKPADEEDE